MPESTSSRKRLEVHANKLRALDLRKSGMTFQQIGVELGVSTAQAYNYVKGALKETLQESADELRTLELERIDRLLLAVWQNATLGRVEAIDRAIKLMERRAKMLGLDAPVQLEATGSAGGPMTVMFVEREDGPQ